MALSDTNRLTYSFIDTEGNKYIGIPYSGNLTTTSFTYTSSKNPKPTHVIYSGRTTLVFWDDGEKTMVRCGEHDEYDREKAVAFAIAQRTFDSKAELMRLIENGREQMSVEEEDFREIIKKSKEKVKNSPSVSFWGGRK